MQGTIDKSGSLLLKRGKQLIVQYCPFVGNAVIIPKCNHECPLFGEPEIEDGWVRLYLSCGNGRRFVFGEKDFTDFRE